MLVLEKNVAKWMNEIRFGKDNNSTYNYKTLYTEGKAGRKWNDSDKRLFLQLLKTQKDYCSSEENMVTYGVIEKMIIKKELAMSSTNKIMRELTITVVMMITMKTIMQVWKKSYLQCKQFSVNK